MSKATDEARKRVAELRARLDRADARGQVELHLGLSDVTLLVTLAELVLKATRKGRALCACSHRWDQHGTPEDPHGGCALAGCGCARYTQAPA